MKKIINITSVIMIFTCVVFFLSGCANNDKTEKDFKKATYLTPIEDYYSALEKGDFNKMKKVYPDAIRKSLEKSMTAEEFKKITCDAFEEQLGTPIKIEFIEVSKNGLTENELRNLENEYKTYSNDEIAILQGYEITVKATAKGNNAEEDHEDRFKVCEINGYWYIISKS